MTLPIRIPGATLCAATPTEPIHLPATVAEPIYRALVEERHAAALTATTWPDEDPAC